MPANADDIVANIDDLISLPGVFVRVNAMVDDPACSVQDVGEVVSQDPGLTARLLKVANSALYGFSQEVDTVSKAVTLIGTKRLRDLVLATTAFDAFDGIPNDLVTMDDFWLHSIYCGLIARQLGQQAGMQSDESLFVAGLLHDIGQLVMYSRMPELAREALQLSIDGEQELDLHEAEQQVFHFDHAELGGKLAQHWHLPEMLVTVISFHHRPEQAGSFQKETAIIHIANSLAVMAELHASDIDETDAPWIHPQAWQMSGLDEGVMLPVIESAQQQFGDMRASLLPVET